jgi:hypothetical protein
LFQNQWLYFSAGGDLPENRPASDSTQVAENLSRTASYVEQRVRVLGLRWKYLNQGWQAAAFDDPAATWLIQPP